MPETEPVVLMLESLGVRTWQRNDGGFNAFWSFCHDMGFTERALHTLPVSQVKRWVLRGWSLVDRLHDGHELMKNYIEALCDFSGQFYKTSSGSDGRPLCDKLDIAFRFFKLNHRMETAFSVQQRFAIMKRKREEEDWTTLTTTTTMSTDYN